MGVSVADGREELDAIEREAARRGLRQKVLLRLTPGIDPHTYEAVATGKVDSKFGAAIETGQAEQLALHALELPHVELMGFHCHVGSQVFGEDIFERAASIMLAFIAHMERTHGYRAAQLDLGGGYGVRYVDTRPAISTWRRRSRRWRRPSARAAMPSASPCRRSTWSRGAASSVRRV